MASVCFFSGAHYLSHFADTFTKAWRKSLRHTRWDVFFVSKTGATLLRRNSSLDFYGSAEIVVLVEVRGHAAAARIQRSGCLCMWCIIYSRRTNTMKILEESLYTRQWPGCHTGHVNSSTLRRAAAKRQITANEHVRSKSRIINWKYLRLRRW